MLSTSVLSFSSSTLVGGVNRIRTEHAIARLQNRNKNISTSTTIRAVGGSSRLRKRNNAIYVKNAAKITPSGTANAPGAKRGTP